MFFHAFTVALIVAAFGWAKRKLTAPVIVIEQYFADSPPGRDIFGANVRRLGIRNILHTFFSGTSAGRRRFYCGSARRWFPACCRAGTGRSFSTSGGRACRFSDDRRTDYHARHRPAAVRAAHSLAHRGPALRFQHVIQPQPPALLGTKRFRKCAYSAAAPGLIHQIVQRVIGLAAFGKPGPDIGGFPVIERVDVPGVAARRWKWSMVYRRRSAVYAVKKSS